jgi:hypothetical protein
MYVSLKTMLQVLFLLLSLSLSRSRSHNAI